MKGVLDRCRPESRPNLRLPWTKSCIFDRISPLFAPIKIVSLLFILMLAIPGAMAALTLNAATPSEVDICNSLQFVAYANNTNPSAGNISINVTIPQGFAYQVGSTLITYPISNISVEEPVIFGQYLNWTNSSWILGNGGSLKICFNLTAGCGAPSGERLTVKASYSGGVPTPYSSPSILVNQGLLKITKEPNVIEAGKWDTVNWTVKIENLGTGPAFNVKVNDTNNTGLKLLSIDSPGGSMNWSYARIDPGEVKTVNTSFQVIACSNLVNLVNVSWGCGGNDCQKTYAKGSVQFIPYEPDLDYTFNPSPIVVPYCNKTFVNVTINNSGTGNASGIYMIFSEFNAPYSITNVSGAQYFENNHTFYLGNLLAGGSISFGYSKSITFDFGMPLGQCNVSGASGVFNTEVDYFDDCGDQWFPPWDQISYSMDASTIPLISVTKSSQSGKDSLYLGESDNYILTVNYQNGSCSGTLPKNTIIDHYPPNFEVVNAADGTVNDTNQTIIWNNQDLNSTTSWSKTIELKVKNSDSCNCGGVYYNDFSVNASVDCCGCPLTASTSLPIIVKCFNTTVLSSSNKTADPTMQENCRLINYTNTYVINNSTSLSWADINFTEEGYNGQTFPDGNITGNASFNLNGCIDILQITLNVGKNLSFLETSCGQIRDGDILKINYTLRQPNAGSFIDWSRLCVKGYNSGCAEVGCFQEETSVTVNQADYGISIIGVPSWISSCRIFNLTLNITKNSPNDDPNWIAHFMSVLYNDTNYRYIGPANITGIVNQSGAVQSFEPTPIGNNLTWELGQNVIRGGNITFKVELRCPANKDALASMNYTDNCGGLVTRTAISSPSLLTFGLINLEKTPEVVYTLDRNASWKIYVTNSGSGNANNVTVVDSMESGLNYTGSRIRQCPTCPMISEPLNPSVINNDPCGPDKVTWKIGSMLPKQQVVIEVNATLCGCDNRKNYVYATIGCGGTECQNVSKSSQVELVITELLVAKHQVGKVDDCGANVPFSIEVRNSAAAYVYNLSIKEILPAGLKLNDTPVVTGATLTSFDYSNPSILIWSFNQTQGIASGTKIAIKFNASVTGACDFNGDDSTLRLNYIEPCGRAGPVIVSQIPVQKYQPLLTVTKTPTFAIADQGDFINWTINISSAGDYIAKNVSLQDVLPEGTLFHSASPTYNSGNGTLTDPFVWDLANMTAGTKTTVYLNVTVTECKTDKENNATVLWGCCSPKSNSMATARVRTLPVITISSTRSSVDTCGGNYTINITNSGSTASTANITDILPAGFIYKTGSSNISSSLGRTFANEEPVDNSSIDGTIIWNSTNIDEIRANESINIEFGIINSPNSCGLVTPSWNNVSFNFTDSCGLLHNNITTDPITPTRPNLQIKKVPKTQSVGAASWTITVNNTGTSDAHNVTITEILGDGFKDITSNPAGTVTPDYPLAGWTTINWTGLTIPIGIDVWTVHVTANAVASGDLNNSVFVEGSCLGGCIYSHSSDQAYTARLNVTKEPDSIETIGDKVNFTITAEFWGVGEYYNDTWINDTLPSGLKYYNWSCKSDSCGSCLPCGGDGNFSILPSASNSILSWKLGNFTGPRVVAINLSTIAKDIASNRAGTNILNRVDASHIDNTDKSFQAYDTANLTLIEPDLQIIKSANVTETDAGSTILYNITLNHSASSNSTAYDVNITDIIPPGLKLISTDPAANSSYANGAFWNFPCTSGGQHQEPQLHGYRELDHYCRRDTAKPGQCYLDQHSRPQSG